MNLDDIRNAERQLNGGNLNDLLNRAKESSLGSGGNHYNDLINKAKESADNWGSWSNWDSFDSNTKDMDTSESNACDILSGEGEKSMRKSISKWFGHLE